MVVALAGALVMMDDHRVNPSIFMDGARHDHIHTLIQTFTDKQYIITLPQTKTTNSYVINDNYNY